METNKLSCSTQKIYIESGKTYKMNVRISLGDECNNGVCYWSITGEIYEKRRNGRYYEYYYGCIHDEILKRFPEFKTFVNLHLSDYEGTPMFAVDNGFYFMKKNEHDKAINYLRVTEKEYNILQKTKDKLHFKYKLYTLNIVDRWKQESLEAIKQLEALTGDTWENPYKPGNECIVLRLTDEERTLIENRIKNGYYTDEWIQSLCNEIKRQEYEKKRAKIILFYKNKQQEYENKMLVELSVLDAGLPVDNVIYYNHRNELVFNWIEYKEKITKEQFDNFVKTVDKTKLPENITFKLK